MQGTVANFFDPLDEPFCFVCEHGENEAESA